MTRFTLAAGLAAAAFCLASGQARAVSEDQFQLRNTGDLVALCAAAPAEALGTAALNFCQGYTTGVYHVLAQAKVAANAQRLFCLPQPEPSRNQAIAGFVKWADTDQARLALAPADGVAQYLIQAFPCPAAKR